MALKQKTINSNYPKGIDRDRYDKEVGEFLTEIGDNFKNITYSSAATVVVVSEPGGIQQLNKPKAVQAIVIVNTCYIIYEEIYSKDTLKISKP